MTLTLTSSPKVKLFETYQLRKIAKICLDIMHRAYSIVSKVKGQGQVKGQIHLIGYNFASNCHRDFKLGSYLPPPSTVHLVGIIVWGNGAAWRRSALSECFSSFSWDCLFHYIFFFGNMSVNNFFSSMTKRIIKNVE